MEGGERGGGGDLVYGATRRERERGKGGKRGLNGGRGGGVRLAGKEGGGAGLQGSEEGPLGPAAWRPGGPRSARCCYKSAIKMPR